MVLARLDLVSLERLSAMKRRAGFVLLALALLVLGEWAGEDLVERPRLLLVVDSHGTLLGAAGLLIVWWALGRSWRRAGVRAGLSALLIAALAAGLWGGNAIGKRAFNACVERGEEVRQALGAYRIAHGRYPLSLAALDRPSLPGKRLLHGNLLSYASDGASYRLGFRDWLYDHQATDNSAFMAHK
jgi:hypothetical protein